MSKSSRAGAFFCALAVFSLVEPRAAALGPLCALVCLAALVAIYRDRGVSFGLLPSLLGTFCGVIAKNGYNLEADTLSYMANVASLLKDFDLDVGNQFVGWGMHAPSRGPAGMTITLHPVGNAFVWAVPVFLAHLYALAVKTYATNFFSPPYFGAVIATNLAIALSGAIALARLLAREFTDATAAVALLAAILASPTVYYLTVQAVMAHGLTFGLTCWAIVATVRASETDLKEHWRWAGAALALATLCRFQAAVLFAMVVLLPPIEVKAVARRFALIAPPAIAILLPQAYAFIKTFGRPYAVPQGAGFMKWNSPHWADTLFSADRGLFNWHPLLLFGLFGLLLFRARLARLAACGLFVFMVETWINGAAGDFNGGDAFGGRRYDIVIPFFAIGFARLLGWARPVLVARPLLLPACAVIFFAFWNFSFISYYRDHRFRDAAPLDELADAQMARVRDGVDATIGALGNNWRFRIYDAFVGLYTYRNYRPGGDFDVATLEPRFLRAGWSKPMTNGDWPLFRYAVFPRACLAIPLEEPFDLRGAVVARAPARIKDQTMRIVLNGRTIKEAELPSEWTEVPFDAPMALWIAGENLFCLEFTKMRPGDKAEESAFAAAVVRVQLP